MEKLQRVLIVDGHVLLRAGLLALLAEDPDIEVLADAGARREADPAMNGAGPQLLLMDGTLPGRNHVDALTEIKQRYPGAPVLMIMPPATEDFMFARLPAGANRCVPMNATHDELRGAIRNALQGKSDPGIARNSASVSDGRRTSASGRSAQKLTQRERDVLKLVAAGRSSKEIARHFGLSVKTVAKHRANLMAKLDLHNSARLTAYAIERGMMF